MEEKMVEKFVEENAEFFKETLTEFVSFKSISAAEEHKDDCRKCADYLTELMKSQGIDAEVIESKKDNPVVYGEVKSKNKDAPTVLVYGHYDVQPISSPEKWDIEDPFKVELKGDELFGRGVADDKGQILTYIFAAKYWNENSGMPVNLKFVFEGNEEGVSHFDEFVKENAALLAADVVVVPDVSTFESGVPAITYSLKGLLAVDLKVKDPDKPLHSGSYGGPVEEPGIVLSHLISSLEDPAKKRILVEGFYDDVIDLTEEQKEDLNKMGFDENELMKEIGVKGLRPEENHTALQHMWFRPTLSMHYLNCGDKDFTTKIYPDAQATLSFRLVPNQNPEKIFKLVKKHIEEQTFDGVTADVKKLYEALPFRTDPESPYCKAVAEALKKGYGTETVHYAGEGGSIPVTIVLNEVLNAPVILAGFAPPDANMHGPNEKFLFKKGLLAGTKSAIYSLEEIAKVRK